MPDPRAAHPETNCTSGPTQQREPITAAPTPAQLCLPKLTTSVGYTPHRGTESTTLPEQYAIGRLAQAGGVNVETVRYYQRHRLLAVLAKRSRGFRYYGPETLDRLRFIRRAQALGLSLEDIRQLLGLDRKRACGTLGLCRRSVWRSSRRSSRS